MTIPQLSEYDFAELVFRSEYSERREAEAAKDRLIAASFTAWQINLYSGCTDSFNKYISDFGLVEKRKTSEAVKKKLAEKGYLIAEKIKNAKGYK